MKKMVVIAYDNALGVDVLTDLLSKMDFDVYGFFLGAYNVLPIFEKKAQEGKNIDLVITDGKMLQFTGAFEKVKKYQPTMKIIFMAGDMETVYGGESNSCLIKYDGVLTKPLETAEIFKATINTILNSQPEEGKAMREKFKRVLLADSEDSTNDLLAQIFSRECLAKEVFSSCQRDEQSELLIKHSPDLLVSDVAMGGLEIIKSAREKIPEIRIVALSGFPKKEFEKEVIEAGADIYLEKPVRKEELIEVVRGLL